MEDDRFNSQILSMTATNPGWQVHVQQVEFDEETKKRTITEENWFPVVAWAVVQRGSEGDELSTSAEPVFLEDGLLMHASEYRRMYSDLTPTPGNPKVRVSIRVERVSD